MIEAPISAPGCFGHASIFKHESKICGACDSFDVCESVVGERLQSFSAKANLADFIARHDNGNIARGATARVSSTNSVDSKNVERKQPVSRVRRVFTEVEQNIISSLPKKTQGDVQRIFEQRLDKTMLESITSKVNPFPFKGKRYLHVACELLIRDGGFTKQSLREHYIRRLSWTKQTSFAHVSMVIAIMTKLSVVTPTKEGFKIKEVDN
jgi:hypothetical protein